MINKQHIILACTVHLTGCSSQFTSGALAEGVIVEALVNSYRDKPVDDIYSRGNVSQSARNIELSKLMMLSDSQYQEFKTKFYAGNSTTQLGFEWTALGLSAGGALVTGGLAPLLSGVSTVVQGAQSKLNTNFFLEKTTETLMNAMDIMRMQRRGVIIKKMAKRTVAEYSTEEGVRDVLDYHDAGSLVSALTHVVAESGHAKQVAATKLNETEQKLTEGK